MKVRKLRRQGCALTFFADDIGGGVGLKEFTDHLLGDSLLLPVEFMVAFQALAVGTDLSPKVKVEAGAVATFQTRRSGCVRILFWLDRPHDHTSGSGLGLPAGNPERHGVKRARNSKVEEKIFEKAA